MTFTHVKLDVQEYGSVSGQFYQPEVHSYKKPDQRRSISKDDWLVILLHGWGADGADLAPLAPSLLDPSSIPFSDTSTAYPRTSGGAVFIPDAPDICSGNPSGRQWFELSDPASGIGRNASACLQAASFIEAMLESLSVQMGYFSDQIILGGFSQGGMVSLTAGLAYQKPLCGLFCLSGAWLTPNQSCYQSTSLPVFLAHGVVDPVLPFACMTQAEDDLATAGFSPQTLRREYMAHGIDPETVHTLNRFIASL